VLKFQQTVNSSGKDKQSEQCRDCICQLGQNTQLVRVDIYYGFWRGLAGVGCAFWLQEEILSFKGPAAYRIGANKMTPNFDNLKGSLREVFKSCSALKRGEDWWFYCIPLRALFTKAMQMSSVVKFLSTSSPFSFLFFFVLFIFLCFN